MNARIQQSLRDKFRIENYDQIQAWSEKFEKWQTIAEFAGWVTEDRKQMVIATLNGNPNLAADWDEVTR